MIETFPCSPLLRCARCGVALSECPEWEYEDWIVCCFECGARNIIAVAITERLGVPSLEIVGLQWDGD